MKKLLICSLLFLGGCGGVDPAVTYSQNAVLKAQAAGVTWCLNNMQHYQLQQIIEQEMRSFRED